MKTRYRPLPVLLAVFTILGAGSARAQTVSAIPRADVTASIASLGLQDDSPNPFSDDDWHATVFGSIGAGWYWTDHLKTEIDFGAGREVQGYGAAPIVIDGRPTYVSRETRLARRTLAVSQQYQFFRNVWFHPYVAAGANVSWDRRTDEILPVVIYDQRGPRTLREGSIEGPRTEVTVRPVAAAGFKAYMTERAFFRTDLRMAFRGGVDEVLLRIGFGVDF